MADLEARVARIERILQRIADRSDDAYLSPRARLVLPSLYGECVRDIILSEELPAETD
jgi:hypothetical protein